MHDAELLELLEDDPNDAGNPVQQALEQLAVFGGRTLAAHLTLAEKMPQVNRAWYRVRRELAEVGLLYEPDEFDPDGSDPNDFDPDGSGQDDGYLAGIELAIATLPSRGEAGYVYEEADWFSRLFGCREGVIFLPADLPREAYVHGATLTDVIRHEFGHAWHWRDPEFFKRPWFRKAFRGDYDDETTTPLELFRRRLRTRHRHALRGCRNRREVAALKRRLFAEEFVSDYAATLFCEDFAETFMVFLRHRRSLHRFAGRPGVFRKLLAIEAAVSRASRELGR